MVLGTFTLKLKTATDIWIWSLSVPIKAAKLREAVDADLHQDSSTITATALHKKEQSKIKSPRSNLSPTKIKDLFSCFVF